MLVSSLSLIHLGMTVPYSHWQVPGKYFQTNYGNHAGMIVQIAMDAQINLIFNLTGPYYDRILSRGRETLYNYTCRLPLSG